MTTIRDVNLDIEEVLARAEEPEPNNRVVFAVEGLYGLSPGTTFPLNEHETIETGPMTMSADPEAHSNVSLGVVDFNEFKMRVRYAAQIVFPALHDLVMSGNHELSLLRPIRATATDECTVSDDLSGWRALGCMEVLPGSLWSGAKGG